MTRASKEIESAIKRRILARLGAEPDLLIANNAIGRATYTNKTDGREYKVPYGWLGEGGPDLVGCLLAPNGLGVMLCFEVKTDEGETSDEQIVAHAAIRRMGGLVFTPKSPEEAWAFLEEARALVRERCRVAS